MHAQSSMRALRFQASRRALDPGEKLANLLVNALTGKVAWNIDQSGVFVAGLLPWAAEPEIRIWRDPDLCDLSRWLSDLAAVCGTDEFIRQHVLQIAKLNRYLPLDAPVPAVQAKLVRSHRGRGNWVWRLRCPYCNRPHHHNVYGILDQQVHPFETLPQERVNPCGNAICAGARGYRIVPQPGAESQWARAAS